MIVEGLVTILFGVVGAVVGLFPTGDAPGWVANGGSTLADLLSKASGLSSWFPFGLAATVLTALFACAALGLLIKVLRIVVSFFTAGGGSAG